MAVFLLLLVLLALFVYSLFSELLEYLHIARHLAAKTGTNLVVSDLVGSFLDDIFLECCIFLLLDFSMGFHQVEMISFL